MIHARPSNSPAQPIPSSAGGGRRHPEFRQAKTRGERDAIGPMRLRTVGSLYALHKTTVVKQNMLRVSLRVGIGQTKARHRGATPRQSIADGRQVEPRQLVRFDEQVEIGSALKLYSLTSDNRLNTSSGPERIVQLTGRQPPNCRGLTSVLIDHGRGPRTQRSRWRLERLVHAAS